ncbi:MAG: ComEA family DNA-binding protein [Faecalibacterium sp.]
MEETYPAGSSEQERWFLLAALSAAALSVGLAFWFAVPLDRSEQPPPPEPAPLMESVRVELNTAGQKALCTLPGIGEKRARAIIEDRLRNGPYRELSDLLRVPGITQEMLDSWDGLAVAG